jgi:hypothetical protein
MPVFQSIPSTYFCAVERPRCPKCHQPHMRLSKLEVGPAGFDYRIFECHKCGRVHIMIVSSDPMESDLHGWLGGASEELPA